MLPLHIKKIGQGAPMCLLHGFGFNHTAFKSLVERLSDKYQFYLVDLPGFGQSVYAPYTLDSLMKALHQQLPSGTHWLGWSLGGTIALAYANQYPKAVKKLMLVATNPCFVSGCEWPSMDERIFNEFVTLCETALPKALKHFLALQFPAAKIDKSLYLLLKKQINASNLTTKSAINALMILQNSDFRDIYAQLTCPVLTLLGGTDQLIPRQLYECLSNGHHDNKKVMLFEKSAHIPFLTEETRFITLMDDFLC